MTTHNDELCDCGCGELESTIQEVQDTINAENQHQEYDGNYVGRLNEFESERYTLYSSVFTNDNYNGFVQDNFPSRDRHYIIEEYSGFIHDRVNNVIYGVSGKGYDDHDSVYQILFPEDIARPEHNTYIVTNNELDLKDTHDIDLIMGSIRNGTWHLRDGILIHSEWLHVNLDGYLWSALPSTYSDHTIKTISWGENPQRVIINPISTLSA